MKTLNNILLSAVKSIAMLSMVIFVTSCGTGTGSNTSSGSGGGVSTNTSIDLANVNQLATPTSSNPCLSITNFKPSIGAWWVSATFNISNSCSSAQSASGLQLILSANQPLNASNFSLNTISFNPWATTTTNAIGVDGNVNAILVTLTTTGTIAANSSTSGSFGYNPNGVTLSGLNFAVSGSTPVQNATLNVTINSSNLNNVCTNTNPCNIPVNLLNSTGGIVTTIATVTNSNLGTSSVKLTSLNPGTYTISPTNMPSNVTATESPAVVTLSSGGTAAVTVNFAVQAPTTGNINYTLVNPDNTLFNESGLMVIVKGNISGTINSIFSKFGSLTQVASLSPESYTISTNGLASASSGKYYTYTNKTATVTAGGSLALGNISATSVSGAISDTIKVNGLASGDSITFNFTDSKGYIFNSETLTATSSSPVTGTYKFLNGDNVTVNVVVNSKYQSVAPFTITQGNTSQSYTINLTAPSITTSGVINFHFYYGASPQDPQDSLTLTGDNYTDLIMSNYIAGILYGHLIQEYTPGIQFNKDYLYGSIFAQLLQENISTQLYSASTNLLDPSPLQAGVFGVGQGGPYQINNYAADMVGGGYAPAGFSLINYVAIQGNIGFTMANAGIQYSKATPPSFNNKYYGPILTTYFHFNDYKALQFIGGNSLTQPWSPASYGWTPQWQPYYYNSLNTFKTLANSPLDILLNVAYNQGFYGPLFFADVKQTANATAATVSAMNSYSNAWGADTYGQYPFQVHNYLDQLYDNPTPSTRDLSQIVTYNNHIAFNMLTLANVFSNVFQTLGYVNTSGQYVYISSSQANAAFSSALSQVGVSSNAILDLSNAVDRAKIFSVIEKAITNLETNLGTNFTATTNTQLSTNSQL